MVDTDQLKPILLFMSKPNMQILTRHSPAGASTQDIKLNESEIYRYNPRFSHPNVRIKINGLQLKETVSRPWAHLICRCAGTTRSKRWSSTTACS